MINNKSLSLFLLIVLISSCSAKWTIELKLLEVPSLQVNSPPHEAVLYSDVQWGGDKKDQIIKTAIDVSSFSNWVISKYCDNCVPNQKFVYECIPDDQCKLGIQQTLSMYALGGKYKFSQARGIDPITNQMLPADETVSIGSVDITINRNTFTQMTTIFPKRLEGKPNDKFISDMYTANAGITAGLGFGSIFQNFENFIINKQFNKKVESKQIAFYVSQSFSNVVVGKEEGFFAKSSFEKFRNMKQPDLIQLKGTFTILLDSIQFQGIQTSLTKNEYYVNFDTTTQYIWVPQDIYAGLMNKFQVNDATCIEQETKFVCTAKNLKQFPNLQFTFKNGKEISTYMIEPKNYVYPFQELNIQKYQIMIKKLRWVEGQETKQIPSLPIDDSIWLGYPFFKQYYTIFNYEDDTIKIAQKAEIGVKGTGPESKVLNDFWRLIFIFVGILIFILTLIILLSIIDSIKTRPKGNLPLLNVEQKKLPEPQSPQQVVFQTVPIQTQTIQIQQPTVKVIQLQQPTLVQPTQKVIQVIQPNSSQANIIYQPSQQQLISTPQRQTASNIFVPSGQN